MSTTIGPFYPASVVEHDGIGTLAWNNESNAQGLNTETYAYTSSTAAAAISKWLWATDFRDGSGNPISIPAGATNFGVVLAVYDQCTTSDKARDDTLQLIVDGAVAGDSKAITGTWYPTTAAWSANHGAANDNWNAGLTVARLNASNFGAALSCYVTKNYQARVYAFRMYITYDEAALFLTAWYVQQRRNRR